ncbi:MAG: hypothetical protein SFV54_09335, partial [Bryobacteraceae bacterium]|nr:hypothetical protein [Bryobacteraceae bacterium]
RWLIERAQRVQTALIRREYDRNILLATYRNDQEKMDLAIARAIDGSAHHYLDTVLRRERRDYFRCLRELERLRKSPLFPPDSEPLTNSHEANPSPEDPAAHALPASPSSLPAPCPFCNSKPGPQRQHSHDDVSLPLPDTSIAE